MEDKNFSPQESLKLIQSMLEKTRQDISGSDIYFLMWGWLTFFCCTAQFLLIRVFEYPKHYLVWWLTVVGMVITIILSVKQGRRRKVRTYVEESMGFLWTGIGISFFVLSMILAKIGWDKPVFPFFIIFYGLGTFISGCLLRFRPLIIGGILAWVIAMIAVYLPYDLQILMGGLSIVVSYIIPAYMLRYKIKNHSSSSI